MNISDTQHPVRRCAHPGPHVAQLVAEQGEDVVLQHELHLVFVDLFLRGGKQSISVNPTCPKIQPLIGTEIVAPLGDLE